MQDQTRNKYAIFNDQFQHTVSVLRDNDAQIEVRHAKKTLKKSDVYKHRVSVLCVNAARIDKINPPRPRENLPNFNLHDYKVRYTSNYIHSLRTLHVRKSTFRFICLVPYAWILSICTLFVARSSVHMFIYVARGAPKCRVLSIKVRCL